jgi:hypothetical protein
MYLHLGKEKLVRGNDIIGIFDLDTTTISKHTRDYLKKAEDLGKVVNITDELPKSFIVCKTKGQTVIYISQLSSSTLLKRAELEQFTGT